MYPNNSSGTGNYSVDYLNQISSAPQSKGPSKLVLIIAGTVGLVAVIIFVFMIFNSGPSATDKATNVYLRLQTLESLASSQQKSLRNNDLRAINSGLILQLGDASSGIKTPITKVGVKTDKIAESTKNTESTYKSNLTSKFEDAKLNVQLDSTYAREMAYQLNTFITMMKSTSKLTSSQSFKDYLSSTEQQLSPFADKLANFADN